MPETYQHIRVDRAAAVVTVTVNRPHALNALDSATLTELQQCAAEIRRNTAVRCAVITGAGERAFVAGADIAAMVEMSAREGRAFARHGQQVMHEIEDLPIPVIAAVNGFALGGGLELALACDLILASEVAKFGQPEINLGIIPGFGGTQRLSRRIGVAAARALIYTGDLIDATEALRLGLVHRVLAPPALMPETLRLATTLAGKSPIAMQEAKAALNAGAEIDLADGCRYEAEAFAVAFGTQDRIEGMRAFLEKRSPSFKGT